MREEAVLCPAHACLVGFGDETRAEEGEEEEGKEKWVMEEEGGERG